MSASPPQDPPDGGGGANNVVSFKDKLVGQKKVVSTRKRVNLIKENLAKLDYLDGDRLYPIVFSDKGVVERICMPWKDALVVKLLGKDVGFLTMRDRLKKMWNPIEGFDIIDLYFGFFLIKFDEEADWANVIEGGPWMLFDYYLSM